MWFPGMVSCRRMSSCAGKLNWHTVGLSEKRRCVILLAMCLHAESNYMNAHSHSIPLIHLFITFIIIGKCLAIGFHPSAHVFRDGRNLCEMILTCSHFQNFHTRNTKELRDTYCICRNEAGFQDEIIWVMFELSLNQHKLLLEASKPVGWPMPK